LAVGRWQFGTFFSSKIETLQMQTIREPKTIDISPTGFKSNFPTSPVSPNQLKRLKIREFISWSVCFAVVCGLTGLLKFLNVGITMGPVTSTLFYLSLAGFIYFVTRIIRISKNPVALNTHNLHELN
jgi:hypothetical protein